MIQIHHDFIRGRLQLDEIHQQSYIVQLTTACIDLNLVIMAVQVLALTFVTTQLMRTRKVALNHYFKLSGHGSSLKSNVQLRKHPDLELCAWCFVLCASP